MLPLFQSGGIIRRLQHRVPFTPVGLHASPQGPVQEAGQLHRKSQVSCVLYKSLRGIYCEKIYGSLGGRGQEIREKFIIY